MRGVIAVQNELKKKPLHKSITGNTKSVLVILLNSPNKTIKIEGKREEWGKITRYYDMIEMENGKVKTYVSYAPTDLKTYDQTAADILLRFDNVHTGIAVNNVIRRRGRN